MTGEKVIDASPKTHGSSAMSDFFRHGSVEERRAVYSAVANAAICEQKDVIRSVKAEHGPVGAWLVGTPHRSEEAVRSLKASRAIERRPAAPTGCVAFSISHFPSWLTLDRGQLNTIYRHCHF